MSIAIKRIYEPETSGDGYRVLVDRLWPRGISKAKVSVNLWLRDAAPSTALRTWFNHDPDKWPEFRARYLAELRRNGRALEPLVTKAKEGRVTLVYSARDEQRNQAVVLKAFLAPRLRAATRRPRVKGEKRVSSRDARQ